VIACLADVHLTTGSGNLLSLELSVLGGFESGCHFVEWFLHGVYAIDSSSMKPKCWHRYVDSVFVIWPHGPSALKNFIN
jgi:hypothetical protein